MASFPNSVKTFTNPTQFDNQNSATVPHHTQHADANDEIAAIEAFLLNGSMGSAVGQWRFKLVSGAIQLQVYNPAGGGTPWHRVYPISVEGTLTLVIDPTGQAA